MPHIEMQIRELKDQLNSVQNMVHNLASETSKDIGALNSTANTIQMQLTTLRDNLEKDLYRIEDSRKELYRKVEIALNDANNLDKRLITIEADNHKATIERLAKDLTETQQKLGKVESQHNKWLGAIAVIAMIVSFLMSQLGKFIG